jgi:hypothetical protein
MPDGHADHSIEERQKEKEKKSKQLESELRETENEEKTIVQQSLETRG